jgi:soluble lytic murein transglycosylase-like protein
MKIFSLLIGAVTVLLLSSPIKNIIHQNPIDNTLLCNIARVESNHNDKAVSKKGAIGRYQIRYSVWHKELKKEGIIKNKKDLHNEDKNRRSAEYILTKYWYQTKDLRKTLEKYSGGAKNYYEKVYDIIIHSFNYPH